MTRPDIVGLLLAAGSGSRLGGPKALVTGPDGVTWLARALEVLRAGGCDPVYAVLGASAGEVQRELPPGVTAMVAHDWAEGMGASLRAGLSAVGQREPGAAGAVVMLVDTPGVTGAVVQRLVARGVAAAGDVTQALSRSTYHGVVGHPVLIGRNHWAGVVESAQGDRGARDYLRTHPVELVECGDLGSGDDIDTQDALSVWRGSQP